TQPRPHLDDGRRSDPPCPARSRPHRRARHLGARGLSKDQARSRVDVAPVPERIGHPRQSPPGAHEAGWTLSRATLPARPLSRIIMTIRIKALHDHTHADHYWNLHWSRNPE